ncbi:hypothetical protein [Mesorhizobium sp. WSM3862]|uniref:hypothetical protein n=1 Tax=Mesorhizobium sp. WSM3862 TaxID=632858 RepID=UPI000BAFCC1C|nr:hypothetical protein [Mesorhizobium sp. WSM3862]PBB96078.1 hypothetical protein CK224_23745 [Mesorhizobium sp. WSM3862]
MLENKNPYLPERGHAAADFQDQLTEESRTALIRSYDLLRRTERLVNASGRKLDGRSPAALARAKRLQEGIAMKKAYSEPTLEKLATVRQ